MTYRDNVSNIAKMLGINNNPGLREEDIKIAELLFKNESGSTVSVVATEMNRAGRLYFQARANGKDEIVVDSDLRRDAAEFFAELWEPNPVPGKRKLLDAIRSSISLRIVWK